MRTPDRETHEYFFRVVGKDDVTVNGATVSPRSLTVQFLGRDGVRTTRAIISGPDREADGTLNPASSHTLTVPADRWPEWVAVEVAGCVPGGWEA